MKSALLNFLASFSLVLALVLLYSQSEFFGLAIRQEFDVWSEFFFRTIYVFLFSTSIMIAFLSWKLRSSKKTTARGLGFVFCSASAFLLGAFTIGMWTAASDFKIAAIETAFSTPATVELSDNGELRISGQITPETANAVSAILAKSRTHPRITITSEGGDVDAAMDIARIVEADSLPVTVSGYCYSACVFIAFASPHIEALSNVSFGFHQIYSPGGGKSQFVQSGVLYSIEETNAFLRDHGVPEYIVGKLADYGPDDLLEVTPEELVAREQSDFHA